MNKEERFSLIKTAMAERMAPTMGCVGPMAFIHTAAVAARIAGGQEIKKIVCRANGKFAARMGEVVTPNLPEENLELALSIGAIGGIPEKHFEVIKHVSKEQVDQALVLSKSGKVEVIPDWKICDLIYVDVTVETEAGTGRAVEAKNACEIYLKEHNGEVIYKVDYDPYVRTGKTSAYPISQLSTADLYEFAMEAPVEDLGYIQHSIECNAAIAEYGAKNRVGFGLGVTWDKIASGSDDILLKARALAAAGSEARMAGVAMEVTSISGSGNLGLATIVPAYALGKLMGKNDEEILRAVTFACLISISASSRTAGFICNGSFSAALAAAGSYVFLHGGTPEVAEMAIMNSMPATYGIICDGARLACAHRVISSVGIGFDCARAAMEGMLIPLGEGVTGFTPVDNYDLLSRITGGPLNDFYDETMKYLLENRVKRQNA